MDGLLSEMDAESLSVFEGSVVSIPEKTKVRPSRHRGVNASTEKLGLLSGSRGRSADVAWGFVIASDPARSGTDSTSLELGGWYFGGPAGAFSALAFFAAGFFFAAAAFFFGEAARFFFLTGSGFFGLSSSDAHSSSSSSSSLLPGFALGLKSSSPSESEVQASALAAFFFLTVLGFSGPTSSSSESEASDLKSSLRRVAFLAAGAALAGFFFGGGESLSSQSSSSELSGRGFLPPPSSGLNSKSDSLSSSAMATLVVLFPVPVTSVGCFFHCFFLESESSDGSSSLPFFLPRALLLRCRSSSLLSSLSAARFFLVLPLLTPLPLRTDFATWTSSSVVSESVGGGAAGFFFSFFSSPPFLPDVSLLLADAGSLLPDLAGAFLPPPPALALEEDVLSLREEDPFFLDPPPKKERMSMLAVGESSVHLL